MKYDEAVKVWAAQKLSINPGEVKSVGFEMDEGFACCGGRNPDCYCSYAESPSLQADIARTNGNTDHFSVDMTEVLRELFAIAESGG